MIGVEGQYRFSFSVAGKRDFVMSRALDRFLLVEQAGNVLPTFELVFWTVDDEVLKYCNEGNDIDVEFGVDAGSTENTTLRITKADFARMGEDKRYVYLEGIYSAPKYIANNRLQITDEKSAAEVIREVARRHFEVKGNLSKSNDKQRWVQSNVSDKKWVNELWMHMDLGDSFPAVAIGVDGAFQLVDVKKHLGGQDYAWRFTMRPRDQAKDIEPYGNVQFGSRSGFVNQWVGYGRKDVKYKVEAGESEETDNDDAAPLLATGSSLGRSADVGIRFGRVRQANENQHERYWEAKEKNLQRLAVMSAFRARCTFTLKHKPIRPLDLLMILDDTPGDRGQNAGTHSGLYLCSKVVRELTSDNYFTRVEAVREAMNEMQGSLR